MRTMQIIGFCVGIGGSQLNARELWSTKSNSFGKSPKLIIQRKSNRVGTNRKLCVRAEYKYVILDSSLCQFRFRFVYSL